MQTREVILSQHYNKNGELGETAISEGGISYLMIGDNDPMAKWVISSIHILADYLAYFNQDNEIGGNGEVVREIRVTVTTETD